MELTEAYHTVNLELLPLDNDPYPFHRGHIDRTHKNVFVPSHVDFAPVVRKKLSMWRRFIKWLNSP